MGAISGRSTLEIRRRGFPSLLNFRSKYSRSVSAPKLREQETMLLVNHGLARVTPTHFRHFRRGSATSSFCPFSSKPPLLTGEVL